MGEAAFAFAELEQPFGDQRAARAVERLGDLERFFAQVPGFGVAVLLAADAGELDEVFAGFAGAASVDLFLEGQSLGEGGFGAAQQAQLGGGAADGGEQPGSYRGLVGQALVDLLGAAVEHLADGDLLAVGLGGVRAGEHRLEEGGDLLGFAVGGERPLLGGDGEVPFDGQPPRVPEPGGDGQHRDAGGQGLAQPSPRGVADGGDFFDHVGGGGPRFGRAGGEPQDEVGEGRLEAGWRPVFRLSEGGSGSPAGRRLRDGAAGR